MSSLYVSSKFVGELVRELMLAFAGLKYGTLSVDEAVGIYDTWLARLADEAGCEIQDDPALIRKGDN